MRQMLPEQMPPGKGLPGQMQQVLSRSEPPLPPQPLPPWQADNWDDERAFGEADADSLQARG
jgi:hypothetical protein